MDVAERRSVKPVVYDPVANRFIVGTTNNQLLVVDADTGNVLRTMAISGSVDGASIDVSARLAFFGEKRAGDIVNLDTEQLVGGLPAEKKYAYVGCGPDHAPRLRLRKQPEYGGCLRPKPCQRAVVRDHNP
jgi:hypothetical protein